MFWEFIGILFFIALIVGTVLGIVLPLTVSHEKNEKIKKILKEISTNYNFDNDETCYITYLVKKYSIYRQDLMNNTNYFKNFTGNNKCYFSSEYEFKAICLACILYRKELKEMINDFKKDKGLDDNYEVDIIGGEYDFIAYIYKSILINSLYQLQQTPPEIEEELEKEFSLLLSKYKKLTTYDKNLLHKNDNSIKE